jgi:hypothetical protein
MPPSPASSARPKRPTSVRLKTGGDRLRGARQDCRVLVARNVGHFDSSALADDEGERRIA